VEQVNEHNFIDHPGADIGWGVADLASQQKLGLWSKQSIGGRAPGAVDTVVDGENLGAWRRGIVVELPMRRRVLESLS
jgi:hypothetical protein